jgi:hypothetical protein
MPPRSRVTILWASLSLFFGNDAPLPQTPPLPPPSCILRDPSHTERDGGRCIPCPQSRQGMEGGRGVPGVSRGASTRPGWRDIRLA